MRTTRLSGISSVWYFSGITSLVMLGLLSGSMGLLGVRMVVICLILPLVSLNVPLVSMASTIDVQTRNLD